MARFKKEWFNPLYFILNDLLKDDRVRIVLVFGGKSSAKTATISQVLSKEGYVNKANSIAFRKESTTIPTTLKKSFELALKTTRLANGYTTLDRKFRCIKGSEIVLKGLDVEDKAKGVEGYKYLYLDELDHFLFDEWTQFNMSLRGIPGQKIFASWNPVSETSWVKKALVDKYVFVDTKYKLPCESSYVKISTCGRVVLIKTTFEDNYWIAGSPDGSYGYRDENLIAEYENLKRIDFNKYRVNVLGEWGMIKKGGEFWKSFDEQKHVTKVSYQSGTTVHISLDENVMPYITQTIWQLFPGDKKVKQIHEILSATPNNNAPRSAQQMVEWLRSIGYKDVVFVYGDPSAGKRSTVDINNSSFYDKYIEVLNKSGFKVINRVGKSAPEVALSAAFINELYAINYAGWGIEVSDKCYTSIEDYLIVKEDADGTMAKPKIKHPDTGIPYEPNGHISDAKRYFLVTALADLWKEYKNKGVNKLRKQIAYLR